MSSLQLVDMQYLCVAFLWPMGPVCSISAQSLATACLCLGAERRRTQMDPALAIFLSRQGGRVGGRKGQWREREDHKWQRRISKAKGPSLGVQCSP